LPGVAELERLGERLILHGARDDRREGELVALDLMAKVDIPIRTRPTLARSPAAEELRDGGSGEATEATVLFPRLRRRKEEP
jgi:hypothetical protein